MLKARRMAQETQLRIYKKVSPTPLRKSLTEIQENQKKEVTTSDTR